jgi:hypothetical protein
MRLVKLFITDIFKVNAARAVRKQQPLEHPEVKVKWRNLVETFQPYAGAQPAGVAGHQEGGGARGRGRGRGRGIPAGQATSAATSAGASGNSGGRGRSTVGRPTGLFGPVAQLQGVEVCFRFNQVTGCQRQMATPRTCQEGRRMFVHACDWFDVSSGKHCLKDHARHLGGHP